MPEYGFITVYTVQYILYSVHSTVCTVQCTQFSTYVLYMQCLDPQEIFYFSVYFLLAGPPPPGCRFD